MIVNQDRNEKYLFTVELNWYDWSKLRAIAFPNAQPPEQTLKKLIEENLGD